MRPRWHRKKLVVWLVGQARLASRCGDGAAGAREGTEKGLRRIRTGALIAIIGLVRPARVMRARPGLAFLLAGVLPRWPGTCCPAGGLRRNAGLAAGRGRPARRVGTAPPRRSAGGPGGLPRIRDPAAGTGGIGTGS